MPRVRRLLLLAAAAMLAGAAIGVLGAAFRWSLRRAESLRIDLVAWAQHLPGPGWLIPVAAAAVGAGVAGALVRWEPQATGSGIPHVEAVFLGETRPPRLTVLPARFFGGVFAIGSGMVLGREGPTIHMGATLGALAARRTRLPESDARMMQAALGGAGLAVAFDAPIAGMLFTLEEVTKSVRVKTVAVAILASVTAVVCSRAILGDALDLQVADFAAPGLAWLPVFVVFGVLTGILGAGYNVVVLFLADLSAKVPRVPTPVRAAVIGALVGAALCVAPLTVGDGDTLTQMILGGHQFVLLAAAGLLAARFFTGPLSYSAGVPGGLFAPLLAVGALWGLVFVGCAGIVTGDPAAPAIPMALAGMAAFFAATVRAPLTGIVIVLEMTAATSMALPMIVATAGAVLAARAVRAEPVYAGLRQRMTVEAPGADERR
ncbi:H(+)/Cl(-) exchange transporter ClcA [Mycolicibacterium parafortuitum]|uniref:ClC family H(+)/Cl(-) exchange transporter n=1 Tax=Mycolicibacterium parafortuitum TaxID=39692 RepID=UPI0032C46639